MFKFVCRGTPPTRGTAIAPSISARRLSLPVVVASTGLSVVLAASASATPRVAGDPAVAQRFSSGSAQLLILGDSINERDIYMPSAYKKLGGLTVGAQLLNNNQSELFSLGMDAFTYGSASGPGDTTGLTYQAGDVTIDGVAGVLPAGGWGANFGVGVVPPSTNAFDNVVVEARITSFLNAPNVYSDAQPGGAFWLDDAPDGSFDITLFSVAGPNGLPADTARVDVFQDSTLLGSAPLPTQIAPQGQWNAVTVNVPGGIENAPGTFGQSTPISVRVRLNDGVTISQGLNFTLAGLYASNGVEDTFGYSSLARSGKTVDWFLDDNVLSDQALETHLQATDTNLVQIWLGENTWGQYTPSQWKPRIQALINKIRENDSDADGSDPIDIALVSQYNTNNDPTQPLKARLEGYSQALAELAVDNEDVVFLNLFDEAGDPQFLNDTYLLDGVHPNPQGVEFLGDKLFDLYAAASLEGDYNASGSVEQGDLDLVLGNWGLDTDAAGIPEGWFLGLPDGAVDQAELDAVLSNWGSAAAPDFRGTGIPEPTAGLALVAAAALLRRRHAA